MNVLRIWNIIRFVIIAVVALSAAAALGWKHGDAYGVLYTDVAGDLYTDVHGNLYTK
jgi:hypothetical protein